MEYMDENCQVIESTNREFISIIETLSLEGESLEGIKRNQQVRVILHDKKEIATNITRITGIPGRNSSLK